MKQRINCVKSTDQTHWNEIADAFQRFSLKPNPGARKIVN